MPRVIGHKVDGPMKAADATGFNAPEPAATERDGYLDKLVKYVPAEVTAVSAGLFAAFEIDGFGVWIALVVLALANVVYLFVNALMTKTQPKWYFYFLATVAFFAWAISTVSVVAGELGVDKDVQQAYILAAAAFVIPLVHTGLEAWANRRQHD